MSRPKLLETHGCQGGAHVGYVRAGWDVRGVDIDKRHARYYPGELIIDDAATHIRAHGHEYRAGHSSPNCQWYSRGNAARRGQDSKWERSIPPIREAWESTGLPYVIENVKDAVWDMRDPIMLCGCMFGLSTLDVDLMRIHLQRPRLFEVNWPVHGLVEQTITVGGQEYVVRSPKACDHSAHEWVAGAYGGARRDRHEARYVRKGGYVPKSKDVVKALLGIEHDMTWQGLFESLPPSYTEWVGSQLLAHIEGRVAA